MLDALILGILQGLTEFLPISSSGHLVLSQELLGILQSERQGVLFEVILHLGTLLAILVAYREDLKRLILSLTPAHFKDSASDHRLILALIIGTIPAGVIGLLFQKQIETIFERPIVVCGLLGITGVILLLGDRIKRRTSNLQEVKHSSAFLVGVAQAFAILPGISRSGSTIVAGMALGIRPEEAARLSFLLSIPAVLGAALLQFKDWLSADMALDYSISALIAGFLASAIVGYLALQWLLVAVRKRSLGLFGIYCLVVGGLGIIFGGLL
jgi:undecaprenyl-diphosphatase